MERERNNWNSFKFVNHHSFSIEIFIVFLSLSMQLDVDICLVQFSIFFFLRIDSSYHQTAEWSENHFYFLYLITALICFFFNSVFFLGRKSTFFCCWVIANRLHWLIALSENLMLRWFASLIVFAFLSLFSHSKLINWFIFECFQSNLRDNQLVSLSLESIIVWKLFFRFSFRLDRVRSDFDQQQQSDWRWWSNWNGTRFKVPSSFIYIWIFL